MGLWSAARPSTPRCIRMGDVQRSADGVRMSAGTRASIRRARGKNRSRAFALVVLSCAMNLGSIFATVPESTPTSSELLAQGRKLLEAGKLAEAELLLDRAEKLAPSDSATLTLDAKVKG